MKLVDLLLLVPIAAAVFLAIRHLIRTNKAGGCAGCPACGPVKKASRAKTSDSCPACHMTQEMTQELDKATE